MQYTPCSAHLASGGCSRGLSCNKRHDIKRCDCGLVVLNVDYKPHVKGARHRKLLGAVQTSVGVNTTDGVPIHEEVGLCVQCRQNVLKTYLPSHYAEHRRVDHAKSLRNQLQETTRDRNLVSVTGQEGVDFGVVETTKTCTREIKIFFSGGHGRVALQAVDLRSEYVNSGVSGPSSFSCQLESEYRWITSKRSLTIRLHFCSSLEGRFNDTVELVLFSTAERTRFVITRDLRATAGDPHAHEVLRPTAPYKRKPLIRIPFTGIVVRSLRPPTWTPTKWAQKLPEFPPPKNLIMAIYGTKPENRLRNLESTLTIARQFMPASLDLKTYQRHFDVLLYIEEEHSRLDLELYTLDDVQIEPRHPRYELTVEGLLEGRPSIVVGDYILLQRKGEVKWYEGRVHDVLLDRVRLGMPDDFSTYKGTKFDVRFVMNRITFRRMHFALSSSQKSARLLFPSPNHGLSVVVTPDQLESIIPIFRPMGKNPEQLLAVASIVHRPRGSLPFILFGPPGTGKSATICEAILQLLDRDPKVTILACAPSNAAADLIADRLIRNDPKLTPAHLFRLNSLTREVKTLSPLLKDYSLINDNTVFAIPALDDIRQYRVIVATCHSGGVPGQLGLAKGHFSHVFIDEAGQATEPEAMVPILSVAGPGTNVVLAGDNKQLSPVVQSPIARSLGYYTSYLMRLMELPVYDLNTFRGRTIVKLVKNFRSHPAILEFPNKRFYNNELVACGNPALTQSLENSDMLPRKKFPLIFHSVKGKDEREKSSPSYFNVDEVAIVKKYCLELVMDRKNGIKAADIGVITPYAQQRIKIRRLLGSTRQLEGIKVGSVEDWQGQERRIIIVSTVRSNASYLTGDIRSSLGFVASPKRFNVAITRAQALLVVVGNPDILSLDPLWRAFLRYIDSRGGWKGKRMVWGEDADDDEDGTTRMRAAATGQDEEVLMRLRAMIMAGSDEAWASVEDYDSE